MHRIHVTVPSFPSTPKSPQQGWNFANTITETFEMMSRNSQTLTIVASPTLVQLSKVRWTLEIRDVSIFMFFFPPSIDVCFLQHVFTTIPNFRSVSDGMFPFVLVCLVARSIQLCEAKTPCQYAAVLRSFGGPDKFTIEDYWPLPRDFRDDEVGRVMNYRM